MRGEYEFILPFPPSVNHYWKQKRTGGRYVCQAGKNFKAVVKILVSQKHLPTLTDRLHVDIKATPPDGRRRDIDNILKALLDSLTESGIWKDDSQVKKLSLEMMPKDTNQKGYVTVRISLC